mmetsp:Transcript_5376/g.15034  ORF Transcript_5376/g.15034 Transcript_5376/m.15034 type:complete len:295 (-) Transcript_5376:35-919(-)|eukprot:CAMPEP_0170206336 /NCGR_PEP_ID=MMETSP0116_2-20130129/2722_1 /TAXON_ID=400756 /ORGANISM="Durinskia baltica, Strain CSIRO CS-38" /LENGTH=294 /DNA_ID=CAMNT_0010456747 /DNA_START=225 /DNA_END=1106 /DNA_ORIENTATION=-
MEDSCTMAKRTKSLVSLSTQRSVLLSRGQTSQEEISSSIVSDGECPASPAGIEPDTKRRVLGESFQSDEVPDEQRLSKHNNVASIPILAMPEQDPESRKIDLPDTSIQASPDEYLLMLTKAQLGIEFEAKPALSLDSFFVPVTEEQMASYTMEAVSAVRNNDLDRLKELHTEGQALDCFNRFGESLLNMACRRGFESIVLYLLESDRVNVRISDDGGRTPLHDACWNPTPQLRICQSLIERDPALLLVADRRGCTAFQYARKEHWDQWRKFLYDNRECLVKLKQPDILSKFAKC